MLEEKVINFGDKIEYITRTQKYGEAEFILCPVFRRGKIKELYIFPLQQPDAKHFYKLVPGGKYQSIYFSAHYTDDPRVWVTYWCKEHKCYSLEFYVPSEGDSFTVESNFGDTITLNWH